MDKSSKTAEFVIMGSNEPIRELNVKHNVRVIQSFTREGGAIITNQYIKKRGNCITKETAGCDYCGWRSKSNNLNEAKIKMRLHKKVCFNEKK